MAAKFPLEIAYPSDAPIPAPLGKWRLQVIDGVEMPVVRYDSRAELALCVEITKAIQSG